MEQEEGVDLVEYVRALCRWWWLIAGGVVMGGAIAALVLFLGGAGQAPSPEQPAETGGLPVSQAVTVVLMQSGEEAGGYSALATSQFVLADTIETLGLSMTVPELERKVSVKEIADSGFFEVQVSDENPQRALRIADGVAASFVDLIAASLASQSVQVEEVLERVQSSLDMPPSPEEVSQLRETLLSRTLTGRPAVVVPAEVIGGPWTGPLSTPTTSPAQTTAAPAEQLLLVRYLLLGGALGGMVAVLLVAGLEAWRSPLRSADRYERMSGVPHLGSIPRWPGGKDSASPLALYGAGSGALVDALQQAATNIELAAAAGGCRSLVLSSPESGDGRTTLAATLGVAQAAGWKDVVLVDADLRNPSLHCHFGLPSDVGLSTLLADAHTGLSDVLQDTDHARLQLITSGPTPGNPLELLKSPRMGWLVAQLKERASLVLVDSPPGLYAADATVIAASTDGILLVAKASSSRTAEVKDLLSTLRRGNANVLGFLWNFAPPKPWLRRGRQSHYGEAGPAGLRGPSSASPSVAHDESSSQGGDSVSTRRPT